MQSKEIKLKNQVCFPLYTASRLITRAYMPLLAKLGLTYPQYLVLMILWETDCVRINEITQALVLNTNTVTPLLQRMEKMELIKRKRSIEDERKVFVELTEKGKDLQKDAVLIPDMLKANLVSNNIDVEELMEIKDKLNNFINTLLKKSVD